MNCKNFTNFFLRIIFACVVALLFRAPQLHASDLPKELAVKELSGAANINGIVESGGGCGCRQFGSSSPNPVALRRIILSAVFLFFVIILFWKGGKRGKKKK